MIGDMIAVGASLRQALSVSLQTSQETLESVLVGLHYNKGYTENVSAEYVLYDNNFLQCSKRAGI
jgi:nitric oxide reductase NorQ protein